MYTLYNVNVERHVKHNFSNNVEIPFISIGIGGKKNPFTSGETNDPLKITVKRVENCMHILNKGNNKITELRTILQRESPNS
jgi:hypothetical protein